MAEIEARSLELEKVVPDFILPAVGGNQMSPRDFKQKCNLVIVYLNLDQCAGCVNYLRDLANNYHVYQELEAEIIAVCPGSVSDLQSKVGTLGAPFPVLADEQGQVGQLYLDSQGGGQVGGVFVTDRFGALRSILLARGETDLPNQQTILDWLNLIELECPECDPSDSSFGHL